MAMRVRPTFLIAEPEPSEALSTRKLVVETAKFNVITAYSGREALAVLQKFPGVDGVLLHSDIEDVSCEDVAKAAKKINSNLSVIFMRPSDASHCPTADLSVSSHDPMEIVTVLRSMFGDPKHMTTQEAS